MGLKMQQNKTEHEFRYFAVFAIQLRDIFSKKQLNNHIKTRKLKFFLRPSQKSPIKNNKTTEKQVFFDQHRKNLMKHKNNNMSFRPESKSHNDKTKPTKQQDFST